METIDEQGIFCYSDAYISTFIFCLIESLLNWMTIKMSILSMGNCQFSQCSYISALGGAGGGGLRFEIPFVYLPCMNKSLFLLLLNHWQKIIKPLSNLCQTIFQRLWNYSQTIDELSSNHWKPLTKYILNIVKSWSKPFSNHCQNIVKQLFNHLLNH